MKALLLASVAIVAASVSAFGANLITFSQTANVNEVVATTNAGDTQTTIAVNDAAIAIGQLISGPPPATAFFDLNATSVDPATTILSAVIQHYAGSFCISTAAGCGGTNILSGTFSDAAFGALGGPGLVVNVNSPPDTLALSSSLISASDLASPASFGLTFTNLSPTLTVSGTTIGGFSASLAGDASANAIPEPVSMALLGAGVLGLGVVRRARPR